MLKEKLKNLINEAKLLLTERPVTKDNLSVAKNKIVDAINTLDDEKYKHYICHPAEIKAFGNVIDNIYVNTDGKEVNANYCSTTDYIEIPDDAEYIRFEPGADNYNYQICVIYDENKNYVGAVSENSNANKYNDKVLIISTENNIIKVKNNMRYLRINTGSYKGFPCVYYKSKNPVIEDEFIHDGSGIYTTNTVNDMKNMDLKPGDVVTTTGYYTSNSEGAATYDIMTYKEFYKKLPGDIRFIKVSKDYVCTPVDEYGNHTLNNGLVARIRLDGTITPEQWGAKGDNNTNDCAPFTHMAAHVKTGYIKFGENKVYSLGLLGENPTTTSFDNNPYKDYMCGSLLGGQFYSKPIFCCVNNLVIDGNGSKITLPNNLFGNNGMGILNFAGTIKNLEIKNMYHDGKGRTMYSPNKTSNHAIFYAPSAMYLNRTYLIENHPLYNENNVFIGGNIDGWEIHDCSFYDGGAMYKRSGDSGGDHILIINPDSMNNVNIHHNKFEAWGRWVFAVDLGGNGEQLTNVKFNDNTCIGANASVLDDDYQLVKDANGNTTYKLPLPTDMNASKEDTWRWRALGFIDYEAKKCWKNMELQRNFIQGSAGWAINGNSRISEDFLIKDNTWIHVGGGYPYLLEFYSGYLKNWIIEDNLIPGGGMKMGLTTENLTVRNNTGRPGLRIFGMQGNIIIEGNKRMSIDTQNYHSMLSLEGTRCPAYLQPEEQHAKLTFINNEYSLGGAINYNLPYLDLDIHDNVVDTINIANFYHKDFGNNDYSKYVNGAACLYGLHLTTEPKGIRGFGSYYKEGETILSSIVDSKLTAALDTFFGRDILSPEQYAAFSSTKNFQHLIGKDINGVKYSDFKIVCTKSGIIPQGCIYSLREQMTSWEDYLAKKDSNKLQDRAYVYYEDNLYYNTSETGNLDVNNPPTHISGIATCGECELLWVDKIGSAKLVGIV